VEYKERIFDIRGKLLTGALTYNQAVIETTQLIEAMNAQGKAIAKKHGKRFSGFTFSSLMR
jgi:hypothetical protein